MDRDQNEKHIDKNLDVVTRAQLLDDISRDEWEFIRQVCAIPELDITLSSQCEKQSETQNLEVATTDASDSAECSSSVQESRVQNIMVELMEYERSRCAQSSNEVLMEPELIPSNMKKTVDNGHSDANTSATTGNSATKNFHNYSEPSANTANDIPMVDHDFRVDLSIYDGIDPAEPMSLSEINYDPINTPVPRYGPEIDNFGDKTEMRDTHEGSSTNGRKNDEAHVGFFQWYPTDQCENTVATEHRENVQLPTGQNTQLEGNNAIVTVEIQSIAVENEYVTEQGSNTPRTNFMSNQKIVDTSPNDCNPTGAPKDAASNERSVDATERRRTRSSNKNHQDWNNIDTREEIAKIRYPDLENLRYQADNNCPDLENPFWEDIKNFSCKRSVFYRKERLGTICPLSYFKEKHESMGFTADSKHILIKSNKNPKMPICMLCHCCRYEVKDAIKCEFCVKAYFELVTSGMGDQKEIVDKWE
ncbi:hypothetical protein QAD02_001217 [Eretmocerus hayati]|uniref:Uncharacterized protein n=1 Tax=Eretmocerus hayati TaxID=131215 RepID=A0ACC2NGD4_9HYME|nr:hypothetical protein QAD02_001217 [Eretmocerus hayati]